jgi:hypothetical protein
MFLGLKDIVFIISYTMLNIQTAVVNNPTFIELQYETLRFFTKGDYTFTVFNDAKDFPDYSNFGDDTMPTKIRRMCERLNIPCVDISKKHHRHITCASTRSADSMESLLLIQRQQKGRYLCLDSDMFPIVSFDASIYSKYAVAIVPQTRSNNTGKTIEYIWNGMYYFDTNQLDTSKMNWRCGRVEDILTDTGGGMWEFLVDAKKTGTHLYEIPHLWSGKWSFDSFPSHLDSHWLSFLTMDERNTNGMFFSELYDNVFFHYRAGGNWEKRNPTLYNANVDRLKETVFSICRN